MLRLITAVMIMLLAPVVLGESHWSNWSDKTLCRLSKDPELIEYRKAAEDRGLSCSADKPTSPGTAVAKTNMEGLLINNFRCLQGRHYMGNIINGTDNYISYVQVNSFDYDGVLIGSCKTFVGLSPGSFDSFLAVNCNCLKSNRYQIKAQ